MSKKMSNAPVYYALAQIKFNHVAAMEKFVPDIQEQLRRFGFTHFDTKKTTVLEISASQDQLTGEPKLNTVRNWDFAKKDKTSGYVLGESFVSFHTTFYETSTEFFESLIQGLRVVHEIVNLDHVSRLGIRYLDAIIPAEGETAEKYLAKGLHGINFSTPPKYFMSESVFETTLDTDEVLGTLICRTHRVNAPLGYPPDLNPTELVRMDRFIVNEPVPHSIVDTDHYVDVSMEVNFDLVRRKLTSLHAELISVFEATTTPYARSTWK